MTYIDLVLVYFCEKYKDEPQNKIESIGFYIHLKYRRLYLQNRYNYMNTNYDQSLKEHFHFNTHQEMLPYIGSNFDDKRILILSESHFVPSKEQGQPSDDWYEKTFDITQMKNNTNTRAVIAEVLKNKGHIMFTNLLDGLQKSNSKCNLNDIAWCNFFQKPASKGESIKPTIKDNEISLEVFEKILETIKPSLVIFVSVLSFKTLHKYRTWNKDLNGHKYKEYNIPLAIIPHPTSVWWNKPSKTHQNRTGKQKFIDVINDHIV